MNQGTFIGSNNKKLAYRAWKPSGKSKGIIVITHGYTEHGGRYEQFAELLTENGMEVYVHDHIGHGLSEGVRAHVKTFETFVDDLAIFIDIVRKETEDLPIYLFGQSMGGIIALLYTARNGSFLSGCILSAPALIVAIKISPFLKMLSKVFSAVLPKIKINKGIAELLSRDPSVIEKYKNDPLVYTGKNRARIGYLLLQLEEVVPPEIPHVTVPICIIQGTEDKIVDPKGARIIYENVGSSDKTLQWFNALYHELLHEPEKKEVMKFLIEWLNKRLS